MLSIMHVPAMHALYMQGFLCFRSGMRGSSKVMPLAEVDAFYTGSSL